MPVLDIKLSEDELFKGQEILSELAKNNLPTIAVFTYATGEKRYTASWWEEFYKLLKNEFSAYNIIEVLPVENISAFDFKIPYFYSKDVREIASFINHTAIFIGADSGIMHLASASGAPTVGLFAITNPAVYIPYNKNSTAIDTNKAGTDEIISIIKNILLADQNNQVLQ
jgi:ADP-heptose:LPS heptosyltransferase